ncbi:MAG: complex I NDUFA9 subunit family protein [Geobacteraceae bacterium]|nr:complex I NDUFA9 subunit family protein [Geobacteraceae bacterium]
MRIFLAGSTGFVGGHVRCALLENGHELRILTHKRSTCAEPGIEAVEGDVTRPETFATALQGCDAVINLVGIIREFPNRGITFERLHVAATKNLLAAARNAEVRRFVQMSALGARPGAVSCYHQTKYRAEEEVRSSGLDWTIFRPSVIFGPKDDFINKLAGFVKGFPLVPMIGDGSYRLQPIDGNDVARCFAMSLDMPETVNQTYELCGRDRFTYRQLFEAVAETLGKKTTRTVQVPVSLIKLITPFLQRFAMFPITMYQITMLLEESICDGTWRETFRFEPVGLEEAIHVYLKGNHAG